MCVCLAVVLLVALPACLSLDQFIPRSRARTHTHHAHTQVDSTWVRLPYGDHALCRYRSQVKTQTRPAGMHASSSMADDVSVAHTHTHMRALMPSCPHALIRAYRWCHGWSSLRWRAWVQRRQSTCSASQDASSPGVVSVRRCLCVSVTLCCVCERGMSMLHVWVHKNQKPCVCVHV